MEFLARIIPEKLPSVSSKGLQRAYSGLQKLPDDYLVYYEPLIDPRRPDFLVVNPETGLIAIEIRSWYPGTIAGVTDEEVCLVRDENRCTRVHPLHHARQYLDAIIRRVQDTPLFSSLLSNPEDPRSDPCFPVCHLLLLPNCSRSQLTSHSLGDLSGFFPSPHTLCREELLAMEQWESDRLVTFFRSLTPPQTDQPLTVDQIRLLRVVIHPDILIDHPSVQEKILQSPSHVGKIRLLDFQQEQTVYQMRQGHQIVVGSAGTGKTTILAARARILHRNPEIRILLLCYNTVLSEQLRRILSGHPRITVFSFDEWAEHQGVPRNRDPEGDESDTDLGSRVYQQISSKGGDFQAYDAVLVDEAQDFDPAWIRSAHQALKDPENGDLLIVSDGYQGRFAPGGVSWKELGINARGRISHQVPELANNYRNTREIQGIARLFLGTCPGESGIPEGGGLLPVLTPRSGLKPLLVWNTSHVNQGEYATFLVRRLLGSLKSAQYLSGLRPDDISILYPYADEQDHRVLIRMIADLSRFCPVQWVAENSYTHSRIHLPGVKIHDSRTIKGMQYRAVMVLFAEYFDKYLINPDLTADRHLLYVALTRPVDFLTLQYTEKTPVIRMILDSGEVDEFIGK